MSIVDLTSARRKKTPDVETVPVMVRSVEPVYLIPMDRLVTQATVVDVRSRPDLLTISRADVAKTGVSDIAGCIIFSGWTDSRSGAEDATNMPVLSVEAAAYLLEGGVRTIASDFPIIEDAADFLLHNNCVLVHCLSNLAGLIRPIVRLIALPLKYEDVLSADARVIAIEE